MEHSPELEWGLRVRQVASRWLFSDLPVKELPHVVLLPLENPDLHDPLPLTSHLSEVRKFASISLARYHGCPIALLNSRLGSPSVAMTVDLLADYGVRAVLGIGFCGAIDPRINSGDLVLPIACVRDEGTSTHYVPLSYPAVASFECLLLLKDQLASCGHSWHCGLVWSTDAVLLETSQKINQQKECHVLAVDMECSTLFTIARLKGIAASAILVASDHPGRCQMANPNLVVTGVAQAAKVVLGAAERLSASS